MRGTLENSRRRRKNLGGGVKSEGEAPKPGGRGENSRGRLENLEGEARKPGGRGENLRGGVKTWGGVVKSSGDWQNLREIVQFSIPLSPIVAHNPLIMDDHLDQSVIHPPTYLCFSSFRVRKRKSLLLCSGLLVYCQNSVYTYGS